MTDGEGPPTRDELAALERETNEARRMAGSERNRRPSCPWCGTATDAGDPCYAHRSLERLFQQANGGQSG